MNLFRGLGFEGAGSRFRGRNSGLRGLGALGVGVRFRCLWSKSLRFRVRGHEFRVYFA